MRACDVEPVDKHAVLRPQISDPQNAVDPTNLAMISAYPTIRDADIHVAMSTDSYRHVGQGSLESRHLVVEAN